jgi:hypothetical protein
MSKHYYYYYYLHLFTRHGSLSDDQPRSQALPSYLPDQGLSSTRGKSLGTRLSDDLLLFIYLFNNFIGAINYFKIISTISTGPKGKGANEAI